MNTWERGGGWQQQQQEDQAVGACEVAACSYSTSLPQRTAGDTFNVVSNVFEHLV